MPGIASIAGAGAAGAGAAGFGFAGFFGAGFGWTRCFAAGAGGWAGIGMPGIICAAAGKGSSAAAAQAASRGERFIDSTPRGKHARARCARRSCCSAWRGCCGGRGLAGVQPGEPGNPDFGALQGRREVRSTLQGRRGDAADAIMGKDRLVAMHRRCRHRMTPSHCHRRGRIVTRPGRHRRKGEGSKQQ